jgi:uncharacterized peroxidase-related enzyme
MKTLVVPTRDQVTPESQISFDILQKRLGKVPNLYATMGHSSHALKAFLDFEETLGRGVFTPKEREAIALVVSELNNCAYCLAGHTALAIKRGFTHEETLAIRRNQTGEDKLNAVIHLATSIATNKGKPDEQLLTSFYAAGFTGGALIELIGLITVRVFTNYVVAATEIPIDFPAADPIS